MEFILIIGALVLFGILEFLLILRRRRQLSKRDQSLVIREWESIREKVDREPKHALIEADKLLDFVLKKRGYVGSIGEKLKKAESLFSQPNAIWEAHKLRNRLVHEVGFQISVPAARKALSVMKQALWDLGVKV